MSEPLILSEQRLNQHIAELEATIDETVDKDVHARVVADWNGDLVAIGLVGKGCEITVRRRGPDVYVAPVLLLDEGIWVWLGLYQEWARERSFGGTKRFSYRSTSLRVHLGFRNLSHKPQIFRAEWSGWAKWNGQNYGQQGGNAAHPHWHFDAVESLRRADTKQSVGTYLAVLREEMGTVEPRSFSPNVVKSPEIDEIVGSKDFSRIHFASAAAWCRRTSADSHVHYPSDRSDIETWVRRTIDYILEELDRLR